MEPTVTNYSAVPPLSRIKYSKEQNPPICRSSSRRDTVSWSMQKRRKQWVLRFQLTLLHSLTRSLSEMTHTPFCSHSKRIFHRPQRIGANGVEEKADWRDRMSPLASGQCRFSQASFAVLVSLRPAGLQCHDRQRRAPNLSGVWPKAIAVGRN